MTGTDTMPLGWKSSHYQVPRSKHSAPVLYATSLYVLANPASNSTVIRTGNTSWINPGSTRTTKFVDPASMPPAALGSV